MSAFKRFAYWFTNVFWYHYKWYAVTGLAVALLAVYSAASVINQERPDFTYLLAVEGLAGTISTEEWDLPAQTRLYDTNGDGKVIVQGTGLGFDDSDYGMANRMKFTAEMSGDDMLLLAVVDKDTLAGIEEQGDYFLPLGELGLPSDPDRPWTLRVEPPSILREIGTQSTFYLCVKALPPEKRALPETQAQYEQAAAFARMLIELS